jgi:hypothetical protein
MERQSMIHNSNNQQSFSALSIKPNGHRKTQARPMESHLIQQSSNINRPIEFTGGAFRNTTLQPDLGTRIRQIIILA